MKIQKCELSTHLWILVCVWGVVVKGGSVRVDAMSQPKKEKATLFFSRFACVFHILLEESALFFSVVTRSFLFFVTFLVALVDLNEYETHYPSFRPAPSRAPTLKKR